MIGFCACPRWRGAAAISSLSRGRRTRSRVRDLRANPSLTLRAPCQSPERQRAGFRYDRFSPVEELVVVIAVPVVLIVVIVVPVAALFFIPFMVVGNLAMIAIPVAVKVLLAIMMRCHPRGAVVGWTGPVSLVPLVAVAHRVLVAGYPNIPCARTWWLHPHYTVRRRRPDSHSDGNLSEDRSRGQQHQYKQFNLHDFDSLSFNCVMNAD